MLAMAEIAPATRFGQPSVSLARPEAGGAGASGFADLLQALLGSTAMPAPAQPSPTDGAPATSALHRPADAGPADSRP